MDHNDEFARWRAEMDQAAESGRDVAHTLWVFYSENIEQGFTVEQAFTLTVTYLIEMLNQGGRDE